MKIIKLIKKIKAHIRQIVKSSNKNNEQEIYYPQYCYNCHFSFVTKERHSKCLRCENKNTVNCFKEKYE